MTTSQYPSGASAEYAYDLLDRVTNVTVRASASGTAYSTDYHYDQLGNLWKVIDPVGGVTVMLYDEVNRLMQRTLPNGIVTTYGYNLRDQVTNIVHSKNGVVIASAAYERQGVGEPTKITREDGSYVVLDYDSAHRLKAEVHLNAAHQIVETIEYGYDLGGNRTNKVVNGNSASYGYLAGHRLSSVTGADSQSFTWDSGGRVASITRDGETLNLGYSSEDRLTSVSDGAVTLNYTYDAQGRRVKASASGSERRFLVAPTLAGDLESPWLVADGNNAVLAGFAYVGAYPLMRFDASGVPTYYLEDAMRSVIGAADGAGLPVAHFHYDGFGNVRAAVGETNAPAGVGGEFRFHGQWLEEASGLYHMRARDYDARIGRFIERDPAEGNPKVPESLNPYQFAHGNPHIYSDPSGEATLIEVNITTAIQFLLNTLKTIGVNEAKSYAIDKIVTAFTTAILKQLDRFIPGFDLTKIGKYLSNNPLQRAVLLILHSEPRCAQGSANTTHRYEPNSIGMSGLSTADPVKVIRFPAGETAME